MISCVVYVRANMFTIPTKHTCKSFLRNFPDVVPLWSFDVSADVTSSSIF